MAFLTAPRQFNQALLNTERESVVGELIPNEMNK